MAPNGFLAKDEVVIHDDFKAAPTGRNEFERTNVWAKILEEFFRQTDGARCVISHLAVFDADSHLFHVSYLLMMAF